MEKKKLTENSTVGQPTLYEDPVPVDFPHLTAAEKHQVGQDQHGCGARRKGSVEATAGLRGEELDLRAKTGSVSSQAWKNNAEVPPSPCQTPAQNAHPRA